MYFCCNILTSRSNWNKNAAQRQKICKFDLPPGVRQLHKWREETRAAWTKRKRKLLRMDWLSFPVLTEKMKHSTSLSKKLFQSPDYILFGHVKRNSWSKGHFWNFPDREQNIWTFWESLHLASFLTKSYGLLTKKLWGSILWCKERDSVNIENRDQCILVMQIYTEELPNVFFQWTLCNDYSAFKLSTCYTYFIAKTTCSSKQPLYNPDSYILFMDSLGSVLV